MKDKIIGVDLGGTNIRAGRVSDEAIEVTQSLKTNSSGTVEEVVNDLIQLIDAVMDEDVKAIGIGVPSVVDVERGIVYDVQYIPSWKEVPLKDILEKQYSLPVFVNNDANCFALGEHYFGKGKGCANMIGLTIGTGLGSGIIIDNKLYAGANCGAGEFGMIEYKDHILEYYASGQFFQNVYAIGGETVFQRAKAGDTEALAMYDVFGTHIGNAIKIILYAIDTPLIVLGGSVHHAYPFFQQTMWQQINTFGYRKSLEKLRIEISALNNSGVLGAAALYHDALQRLM